LINQLIKASLKDYLDAQSIVVADPNNKMICMYTEMFTLSEIYY